MDLRAHLVELIQWIEMYTLTEVHLVDVNKTHRPDPYM